MFNFFRRNNKLSKKDFLLLKSIVNNLKGLYPYLNNQVNKDFILDKIPKPKSSFAYNLRLNSQYESKFSNKTLPNFFLIKNILVWNKLENQFEPLQLEVVQGMLAGYSLPDRIENLDFNKIDVTQIFEKHFENNNQKKLLEILGEYPKEITSQLDLDNSFEIDIPEFGRFYTLKDFKDGNYIAINKIEKVYLLIHDPYNIECIYHDKSQFFNDLATGKLDLEQLYEDKTM